ncbi:DUF2357 domain-containing protein [Geminocystis sp. GBBB08]|uniref:DUF2357 domain-containing protein n=1 Tax=Geminocystis sp. GBBB08 TaxID=2604140 RepID=UPI0027E2CE4A|nr:DUF2357 domain-containing protein [Geminocystis sp. GBBB08]MBL1209649.1 DUF2357 domain-containing protein [Geminocystis sp. GBBB08]
MLFYASLTDYLFNRPCEFNADNLLHLRGCDRGVLVLEKETLKSEYNFLIERGEGVYEIGFPLVEVADWENNKTLTKSVIIETNKDEIFYLTLEDDIFDETQITNDENLALHLQKELGVKYDKKTAEIISLFISLFRISSADYRQALYPLDISDSLAKLSEEDARLPLILALNKRYELRHKLQLIAPKLRSQLNRKAEMMPLGNIQEMDAYCLRDYVKKPGKDAIEKAGARQELMGIKRYQNFNTPENRFLKSFCDLLHLHCRDYRDSYSEAKSLETAINKFRQEESVKSIPMSATFIGKPNYVLQQNPIYRSFYQAYQDYLKRRSEKEKIWSFRNNLLIDVVAILLLASLLNLKGSYIQPLDTINILDVPSYGKYLKELDKKPLTVSCFLQRLVFSFNIQRHQDRRKGDLTLTVTRYLLGNTQENPDVVIIPLWIFWHKPSLKILEDIKGICDFPVVIYLTDFNNNEEDNLSNITLIQIPDPLEQNLEMAVTLLTQEICYWLEEWV